METAHLLNDHRSGYEGQNAQLLMDALDAADNRWTARLNGGESIEDMKQRVAIFLHALTSKPYKTVLIVTSGWVIRTMVAVIEDISNDEAWDREAEQGDYLELEEIDLPEIRLVVAAVRYMNYFCLWLYPYDNFGIILEIYLIFVVWITPRFIEL